MLGREVKDMDENKKWWLVILFLLRRTDKQWRDFVEEVKHNNRYFPKSDLLDDIKRIQKYAVCQIRQGEIFYRARLFGTPWEYCREELEQVIQIILKYYPNMGTDEAPLDINNLSDLGTFFAALSCVNEDNQLLFKEIEQVFNKEKKFWGYDETESDAPPKGTASAGRANPKYISYLYAAEDIKTAMMEVRPNLSQDVNIATIRIIKDLKLFDFCYVDPNEEEKGKSFDLNIISSAFSTPNFGGEDNYFASQYLCEFIKELGFDGIRFYSSLNPEGRNIVLFDTNRDPLTNSKKYEITESKVYNITRLDLEYELVMPVQTDETSDIDVIAEE